MAINENQDFFTEADAFPRWIGRRPIDFFRRVFHAAAVDRFLDGYPAGAGFFCDFPRAFSAVSPNLGISPREPVVYPQKIRRAAGCAQNRTAGMHPRAQPSPSAMSMAGGGNPGLSTAAGRPYYYDYSK